MGNRYNGGKAFFQPARGKDAIDYGALLYVSHDGFNLNCIYRRSFRNS
jgi:hypothetical protein